MKINIAFCGRKYPLQVNKDDTIFQIKYRIQMTDGLEIPSHNLIFNGHRLENNLTISDYMIS